MVALAEWVYLVVVMCLDLGAVVGKEFAVVEEQD
jgi:hypothetical protein